MRDRVDPDHRPATAPCAAGGVPCEARDRSSFPTDRAALTMWRPESSEERLSKELKVPVVIDNKAGGGGLIGATAFFNTNPDGYTLLAGGGARDLGRSALQVARFRSPEGFPARRLYRRYALRHVGRQECPVQDTRGISQIRQEQSRETPGRSGEPGQRAPYHV